MVSQVLNALASLAFFASAVQFSANGYILGSFVAFLALAFLGLSLVVAYLEQNGFVVDSADIREGLAALIFDVKKLFRESKAWTLLLLLRSSMVISRPALSPWVRLLSVSRP